MFNNFVLLTAVALASIVLVGAQSDCVEKYEGCQITPDCCDDLACRGGTCKNATCAESGEPCGSLTCCDKDDPDQPSVCSGSPARCQWTCGGLGSTCTKSSQCCGGNSCDGGKCVEKCSAISEECTSTAGRCCGGNLCIGGTCELCRGTGQTCDSTRTCCGQGSNSKCEGGTCKTCLSTPNNAVTNPCRRDSDCCSGRCLLGGVGACMASAPACKSRLAQCTENKECCGRVCENIPLASLALGKQCTSA